MQGDKAEPCFNQNKEKTRNLNYVGESLHDKSSLKPVLCIVGVKLFKDNNKNSGKSFLHQNSKKELMPVFGAESEHQSAKFNIKTSRGKH